MKWALCFRFGRCAAAVGLAAAALMPAAPGPAAAAAVEKSSRHSGPYSSLGYAPLAAAVEAAPGAGVEEQPRDWIPWLLGGLGAVGLGVVFIAWTNVRLHRKVAERTRELREAEDRWRLAVRGINDGIWDSNLLTDEIFLSDRCLEMLGFAPGEIKPSRSEWLARLHPEDEVLREASMQEHIRGRASHYNCEFRMRCKDESYKWILSRGQVLFDAEGRPARGVGSHTDIHARKIAEQALRASEERFRALFENAVEGVYETTAAGAFRNANPALARMLGYGSPEALLAAQLDFDVGLYVAPGRRTEFLRAVGETGALVNFESEVRRADGAIIWVSENVRAVKDETGELVYQGFVSNVTAHKQAEAALRESEERFRTLFEQSPIAILEYDYSGVERWFTELWAAGVTDLEAEIAAHPEAHEVIAGLVQLTAVNEAAVRLARAAGKEDFVAKLTQLFTREAYQVRLRNVLALWRGENQTEGEVTLRTVDGAERRLFYRWWMPRVNGRQNFRGAQVVLMDITETRAAEQALRASEERYRVLFEHSPVAIIEYDYRQIGTWLAQLRAAGVTDLERHFEDHPEELEQAMTQVTMTGVNEETVRLLRAPSRQQVFDGSQDLFTAEARDARRAAFLAVWDGRNEIEGELTLRAFDGTAVRVYYRWWLPLLHGQLSFAWTQVVLVDLTDIKRTEAALAAERERLRVTLRSMKEGVITIDTEGCVQFINDAAAGMTGWTLTNAIGRPIGDVCALRHERTRVAVELPFADTLKRDRAVDLAPNTVILDRQGGDRVVEGRWAPMHAIDGALIGVVLVFRDITERSRLESELLRSSKLESVGLLAGGIAHDFNNILTIVMGNITLAMLDSDVMTAAGKWLRDAERGIMRARDLTQQLLTFAKGGDPVRSAVPLPDVVREAAEFALHGSKVKCEFEPARDAWPADVDKGQIGQVVQNLVINAVQAMPEGGVIRITTANERVSEGARPPLSAGNYLKISIADSGGGIRPEHLPRIFDPYFTTKQQGSGLGLATVYSIIRKHEGHITVESEVGTGTTFHLWLPAARTMPQPAAATTSPFETLKGRVLFMDDEEPIREMASVLLSRIGFETTVVRDGEEAVEEYVRARTEGQPYDVVVMDLTVPGGMGGKETIEALRRLDGGVRAIVSSGYSSDPIMANYREHGFLARVAKPYRLADFAKALQAVMAGTNGVE